MPGVLEGGTQILLANILTPKRLICTYVSDMAHPVPSHDHVLVNRSMLCNCHMEFGLTYLLKSIAFCETASADFTMSFTLILAFLHVIQDLWPGNFFPTLPIVTKEELTFPLGLTSNADFCKQDPNVSYPIVLMQEPQSLSALCSSLRARGATPPNRNPPFLLGPRQVYPIGHHGKGSFLFHVALHIFYFSTGIILFVSLGPQVYACIKQGKLKTLVATMALYKLPYTEAFNGTLPMSAPIVPNERHAKYVCLDPWINALVTLASLRTIVDYIMVRCRRHTLCRGLEYATACHIYIFISRNDRYSPIKLQSTTGLLYNFVTNHRLPMEASELHRGCRWDSMHINWGEVTLTNGDTKIRIPYNVQIPMRGKSRLRSLMKGPDCKAHLMVLQGPTWYTVSTTPTSLSSHAEAFFPRIHEPTAPK